VIPVKRWPTETSSQSFRKYLNDVLGKNEIKELQKTAILGIANITSESTNKKSTKDITWEIQLHAP
jgi:hypothetical protein